MNVQKPESANGLKSLSKKFRDDVLKLNLKTPPDIIAGLLDTEGSGMLQAYEYALGKDAVIGNQRVKNPGTIDSEANKLRAKILAKNRPLTLTDFSELDANTDNLGYTYFALSDSIGKLTQLSDYSIPTLKSVSSQFNLTSDKSVKLNTSLNKFVPESLDKYNVSSSYPAKRELPYVNEGGSLNSQYVINDYSPSDILNININKRSGINYATDPLTYINYSGKVLQNETLLMNIAALELNAAFDARIQRELAKESPFNNMDDALGNPLQAINILKNPKDNLISKNYDITVPNNPIGRVAYFTNTLLGTTDVFNYLNLENQSPYSPSCFNTSVQPTSPTNRSAVGRLLDDILGKSSQGADNARDITTLNNTGAGQKFQLFSNLYFNRYAPSYDPTYESGIFQAIDKTLQAIGGVTGFLGITGGKRPKSRYYFGDASKQYPFFALQDSEGDQVKGVEEIGNIMKTDYTDEIPGGFIEPGYDEVSGYGSISTDFVWHKDGYLETFYDPATVKLNSDGRIDDFNTLTKIDESYPNFDESYPNFAGNLLNAAGSNNYIDRFRECSILFKTQRLLEKVGDDTGINLVIDQTKTKFYDGYTLYPRGNGTLSVVKTLNADKTKNVYAVPGLRNGKRHPTELNDKAEFCRTWTKTRPFMNVTNLIRFSELNRLERGSVIDKYANFNIFPSSLNVKSTPQSGINVKSTPQGAINDGNATKFMFSLENLAWRDAKQYDSLRAFEKGPNKGRIMWFPPYDLKFTDDTSVNWTTHQFLGRPEPIYTYNNTERSGSLSFKIIVDHPTILNILVQKELDGMPDSVVDEILNSFWAGCVNFDIYELARIWARFSTDDITYFESVIAGIQTNQGNDRIKNKLDQCDAKEPTVKPNNDNTNNVNSAPYMRALFFENDTPLESDDSNVGSYGSVYFDTFSKLALGTLSSDETTEAKKGRSYAQYVTYDKVIGVNGSDIYFSPNNSNSTDYYKLYQNFKELSTTLNDLKTKNGNNITINIDAFTSSLNDQVSDYNKKVAIRRYKSVAKWILTEVFTGLVDDKNQTVDQSSINTMLNTGSKITLYRPSSNSDKPDSITVKLNKTKTVTPSEAMLAIGNGGGIKHSKVNNVSFTTIIRGVSPAVDYKVFYCTDTQANKEKLISEISAGTIATTDGIITGVTSDSIGCLAPATQVYSEADVICAVTSIQASYARRAEVTVISETNVVTDNKTKTKTNTSIPLVTSEDQTTKKQNITKREIAQKLLNRLITEADYFKYMEENTPIIHKSLKEKLKYFLPAFHSMTPEGLNSRLTFLQQCLRPGDTITNGAETDATNTVFGKPPVCVLRIGDFYNTKIIINSCNISYDPMLYDLNPEGIGVQPMIANVNISFKYLGGSGLKKHVNELQNALSFNYYANADIYDERTSANLSGVERQSINEERDPDPSNNDTLDLIPIARKAREYKINDKTSTEPVGLVGDVITKTYTESFLGDSNYSLATELGVFYDSGTVYQPFAYSYDGDIIGLYGINYYQRLYDDKVNNNATANVAGKSLTDTKAWKLIDNKNFGQEAFISEYSSKGYLQTFDVNYKGLFTKVYDSYLKNISDYIDTLAHTSKPKFLLNTLLCANYTGLTITDDLVFMRNIKNNLGVDNAVTSRIYDYYRAKAVNKNYTNGLKFAPGDTAMVGSQLHLYPQSLYYKKPLFSVSPNSTSMLTGMTYNPGYLTDGVFIGSDVAGLYTKKPVDGGYLTGLYNHFIYDLNKKIDSDLLVFWYNDTKVLDAYMSGYDETQKDILRSYLLNQLKTYSSQSYTETITSMVYDQVNNLKELNTNLAGLTYALSGYDGVVDNDRISQQYTVIPNETKLTIDSEKLFGYDPFDSYLKIYDTNTKNYNDIVKLKVIHDIFTGGTLDDKLALGNSPYYFRQVGSTNNIAGSSVILNNTSYLTNDSYCVLPNNTSLLNGTTLTGDVNNFQLKSHGSATTIEFDPTTIVGTTQFNLLIPTLANKEGGSTLQNKYKMTYVYEKVSHEFLEFTNKSLGVVANDNIDNYTISWVERDDLNFKTKVKSKLSTYTSDEQELLYKIMFPKNSSGVYEFNYFTVTGTTTDTNYSDATLFLMDGVDYSVSFTDKFIDNIWTTYNCSTPSPDTSVQAKLNTLKGTKVAMSSLSEAVMLEFFEKLYANKDVHIKAIMDQMSKTITGNSREISRKTSVIQTTLTNFFEQINKYVTKINTLYDDLIKIHKTNVYSPLTDYLNTSFNTVANQNVPVAGTVKLSSASLLKGGDSEYTLKMRVAKNIEQTNNNILIYNKYRVVN